MKGLEKMKVNHEQTKNKIFDIAGLLREQARYAKNYKQEQIKITSDEMLAQKYKNDRLAELMAAYIAKHKETKEKVVALLNDITPIELEQEAILEFDVPEFQNTLAAINAAQGRLPADVMTGIKLNFAGQYQALLSIKAAFERYEIDLAPYGYEEYTTSAGFAIQPLIHAAENIEQEETSTIIDLQELFKKVIHFGEVRGIKFSEEAKTFGDGVDDEVRELLALKVMGLM